MRLLVDTQAFLWFIAGNARLSASARAAIEDPANERLVSVASAWEIAIKLSIGKLTLAEPLAVLLPRELSRNGMQLLSIDLAHVLAVASLPFHHRDPFDRLLVAQCAVEGLSIVSSDPAFDLYSATRIW